MYIDNVNQCFSLLDQMEKERSCFTESERQVLYRIAFHTKDFDEVRGIILQLSAPNMHSEEKAKVLEKHMQSFPEELSDAVIQIEDYIFQLRYMTYEKEKANQMLEDILSKNNISYDLDALIAKMAGNYRNQTMPAKSAKAI